MGRSVAFLYPGQGRIPRTIPAGSERVEGLLDEAEARGLKLRRWLSEGRSDMLACTENVQPALLIDSLACDERLRVAGWRPDAAAGHSLGEYAALVGAGALDALDALAVVIERGRAMAGIDGAMAAVVNLGLKTVESLCEEIGPGVSVANHNAPTQVVVSGDRGSVDALRLRVEARGGRSLPLPVSGPFHSAAMRPAQAVLEPRLRRLVLRPPEIPVVSAVSAAVERDVETLRGLLCRQITAPVRWVDVVGRLEELGISAAVEVGTGDVLTKLGRRTSARIQFMTCEEALDGRT